jgi:hypothetical protein
VDPKGPTMAALEAPAQAALRVAPVGKGATPVAQDKKEETAYPVPTASMARQRRSRLLLLRLATSPPAETQVPLVQAAMVAVGAEEVADKVVPSAIMAVVTEEAVAERAVAAEQPEQPVGAAGDHSPSFFTEQAHSLATIF